MSKDVGEDGEGVGVFCFGVCGVNLMVLERVVIAFFPNSFGKSC